MNCPSGLAVDGVGDRVGLAADGDRAAEIRGRQRVQRAERARPAVFPLGQDLLARLAALKEFSDLGAGFKIAALDLELRGAGNLLGGEQSGHIDAVGFEMYMKLLEQAVRELKGEEVEDEARASVNLGIDIRIDDDYVPDMAQRLVLYRKVAAARTEAEIGEVLDEIADRYGPLRESVLKIFDETFAVTTVLLVIALLLIFVWPWGNRQTQELRERFNPLLASGRTLVSYCGSGVTACHLLLAMGHAHDDHDHGHGHDH